jgi:hypothetical protein
MQKVLTICITLRITEILKFVHRPEFYISRNHNVSGTGEQIQFPKHCALELFTILEDVQSP